MSLVVYRLAHGLSCKDMDNLYEYGESTLKNTRLLFAKYFLLRMDCSEDIFTHLLDID